MRADRLLSLLLLLQTRGQMTAQELANALEVSPRTIYRDLDALSIAGVPVYAERGPQGGCRLLESYRTNLTGLKEDEVRALFMLTVPGLLADLGLAREAEAALLKLTAALPTPFQQDAALVRQRLLLTRPGGSSRKRPCLICRCCKRRSGRRSGWLCCTAAAMGVMSSACWTRMGWWPRPASGMWWRARFIGCKSSACHALPRRLCWPAGSPGRGF